jgi:hypothetical protein
MNTFIVSLTLTDLIIGFLASVDEVFLFFLTVTGLVGGQGPFNFK